MPDLNELSAWVLDQVAHDYDRADGWGPTFQLVLCDVLRRLVAFANEDAASADGSIRNEWGDDPALQETLLTLLALPYEDRPGYREDWRP